MRRRPCLIIRPGVPTPAERLLCDHRPRAFRIQIQHARGVFESRLRLPRCDGVFGEDAPRQGVPGGGVDEVEGGVPFCVGVDIDAEDGTEEFSRHDFVAWVGGAVDGWVHEVACFFGEEAPGYEFEFGVLVCGVDELGEAVEGAFVDYGVDEVLVFVNGADAEMAELILQVVLEFRPDGFSDVDARVGRALLALVFEGGADGVQGGVFDVRGGVHEAPVLAAGFADDSRVGVVDAVADAVADLLLYTLEDLGGSDEGERAELRAFEEGVGDLFGITRKELNHVLG